MVNPHLISTGLAIHHAATVIIPADVARTMLSIQPALPSPSLEYGVYLKGTWDAAAATVTIAPGEVYFPFQTTTSTSIQFTEPPPSPEWNVIMHRHPENYRQFSTVDRNSINEEFLASILFIPPWEFPSAVVNVPLVVGSKLQAPARVVVHGGILEPSDALRRAVETRLQELQPVLSPNPLRFASQKRKNGGRPLNELGLRMVESSDLGDVYAGDDSSQHELFGR
jgi:hypothetical protein